MYAYDAHDARCIMGLAWSVAAWVGRLSSPGMREKRLCVFWCVGRRVISKLTWRCCESVHWIIIIIITYARTKWTYAPCVSSVCTSVSGCDYNVDVAVGYKQFRFLVGATSALIGWALCAHCPIDHMWCSAGAGWTEMSWIRSKPILIYFFSVGY